MELLGAAWATVIARTVTLVPVVYLLARLRKALAAERELKHFK
jgi:Na+-driven multidrug efflux pump